MKGSVVTGLPVSTGQGQMHPARPCGLVAPSQDLGAWFLGPLIFSLSLAVVQRGQIDHSVFPQPTNHGGDPDLTPRPRR